jgi:hypothetical protein
MSAWQLVVSAAELGAAAAILGTLAWAAIERGRAHRQWLDLRRRFAEPDHRLPHWCMAVGTVAGCA